MTNRKDDEDNYVVVYEGPERRKHAAHPAVLDVKVQHLEENQENFVTKTEHEPVK